MLSNTFSFTRLERNFKIDNIKLKAKIKLQFQKKKILDIENFVK